MANRSDNLPLLGLAATAVALLLVPLLKLAEPRAVHTIEEGPEPYLSAAQVIDAYWSDAFSEQYAGAPESYRTPKVVFSEYYREGDEIIGDYAGYYREEVETIRVFLEEPAFFVFFVLAHEFGHHVQKLSGIAQGRDKAMAQSWSRETQRQIGVRYELQAECLAGVWAHHAAPLGQMITSTEVDKWRAGMTLSEDSDTHGSAGQRLKWFDVGYQGGVAAACDTFAPDWRTL